MTIILVVTIVLATIAGAVYWRFGNPFLWGFYDDDDLDMVPDAALPAAGAAPARAPRPAAGETPSQWPHPSLIEGFSRQAEDCGATKMADLVVAWETGLFVRVMRTPEPDAYVLLYDSVAAGPWKEVLLHYADGSTYTASTLPVERADRPRPDEDVLEWFERHTSVAELLAVAEDNASEQVVLPATAEEFEQRFATLEQRVRDAG
ncbi:MAG: hypothetical protein AAFX58_06265 [Pseudomonadota bacterium]